MSPEPLPAMLPVAPEPERRAPRQALQLVRQQRRVGRDDDDDRAGLGELGGHERVGVLAGISRPTGTPAMRRFARMP